MLSGLCGGGRGEVGEEEEEAAAEDKDSAGVEGGISMEGGKRGAFGRTSCRAAQDLRRPDWGLGRAGPEGPAMSARGSPAARGSLRRSGEADGERAGPTAWK